MAMQWIIQLLRSAINISSSPMARLLTIFLSRSLILSQEEPRLVDVQAYDVRISGDPGDPGANSLAMSVTNSVLTSSRGEFRRMVIDRDQRCVMTGAVADSCDACHILPHAKDDEVRLYNTLCIFCLLLYQYIEIVTRVRGGDQAVIEDKNDIRNGILLGKSIHYGFGSGKLVFLKVRYAGGMSMAEAGSLILALRRMAETYSEQ